jgi:hypothetical protein
MSQSCVFRVAGRIPELWDPETGQRFAVAHQATDDGRSRIHLEFDAAQSWFVVFRDQGTATADNAFVRYEEVESLDLPWKVRFDRNWGSDKQHAFPQLSDWSKARDPLVRYYSGTGTYRSSFILEKVPDETLFLDLGRVEVVARVRLNGKDLGVSWRPPHCFAVGDALRARRNTLEIEVANTWVNRLVGDEQLPLDGDWKDWETLMQWPDWFPEVKTRLSGRYTFTTARHYTKQSPLQPSGLLGPIRLVAEKK